MWVTSSHVYIIKFLATCFIYMWQSAKRIFFLNQRNPRSSGHRATSFRISERSQLLWIPLMTKAGKTGVFAMATGKLPGGRWKTRWKKRKNSITDLSCFVALCENSRASKCCWNRQFFETFDFVSLTALPGKERCEIHDAFAVLVAPHTQHHACVCHWIRKQSTVYARGGKGVTNPRLARRLRTLPGFVWLLCKSH